MPCLKTLNKYLKIWIICKGFLQVSYCFAIVVYEKKYLEAYTNDQYIYNSKIKLHNYILS